MSADSDFEEWWNFVSASSPDLTEQTEKLIRASFKAGYIRGWNHAVNTFIHNAQNKPNPIEKMTEEKTNV